MKERFLIIKLKEGTDFFNFSNIEFIETRDKDREIWINMVNTRAGPYYFNSKEDYNKFLSWLWYERKKSAVLKVLDEDGVIIKFEGEI